MEKTGRSVEEFVAQVTPSKRQRDAESLIALLSEVSAGGDERARITVTD